MCGICGVVVAAGGQAPLEPVRRMAAALAHRGPDADGFYQDGPAALGHRRLAVIDLRPEGRQPMGNEDGTVQAVVNGEIYNYQELRAQLLQRGHRLRSMSDSEVVVHLYEEEGDELLARLRGMFALALWDQKAQRLLLARDRAGEKPLCYARTAAGFFFASELQALAQVLPRPLRLNLAAVDQYLTLQYVPAPLTIYEGVAKLPAAHQLTLTPGGEPVVRRYWRLSFAPRPLPRREEAVAAVRARLEEVVASREVADVPLGAFLSGGVDSSTVVALMARRAARPVRTFSIDFPAVDAGEVRFARLVAARYRTEHTELTVTPDMVTVLPELVGRYGEPFADASAVPTYYLCKLARQHLVVALSGDGGDEAFAGYTRYTLERLSRGVARLPRPLRRAVQAGLGGLPGPGLRAVREFAAHLSLPVAQRYLLLLGHLTPRDKEPLLGPLLRAHLAADGVARDLAAILARSDAADEVNRLLDLDTQTYLPDDILTKVDIASMAHALEVRAPLVDHLLLEQLAGLPGSLKLRGLRGKWLLREAVRDLVPWQILHRRKKGFGLPLGRWMREELWPMAWDLLTDRTAAQRGLFEAAPLRRMLEEHRAGIDHGDRLWNLLVLELWLRQNAAHLQA